MLRFFLLNFRILPKSQLRRHLVEFFYVLPMRRVAHQKCCMAFMNLIGFLLDFFNIMKKLCQQVICYGITFSTILNNLRTLGQKRMDYI